jgi:hypothetical protein
MLSDRDIEQAHPEAFDFAFGNLPVASRADFNLHLSGCRYCQGVVDAYADLGPVVRNLPPHAEPPAGLEERTVAAMVATLAEQRAKPARRPEADDDDATQAYPIPDPPSSGPQTRLHPRPSGPPAPSEPPAASEPQAPSGPQTPSAPPAASAPQAPPAVAHLPAWRRYRVRLAAVAAAAAIIAAIVVPLSSGGGAIPAQAAVAIPLHATAAGRAIGFGAATGRAIAREDASGSWHISLTVAQLKSFGDRQWYECWYISRDGQQVASAGTFQVPDGGSRTFPMTSAVDPHDFPTMEITIGPPTKTGARAGTIILTGHLQ